jgi:aminoglycoside phosphotransferase (APT) family kinase protein
VADPDPSGRPAGEPIASGRDADIYDAGPGRVLRRSRKPERSQRTEATVMRHVAAHGYPCPQVFEVSDDGVDLVMERIDGPTMLDDLGAHPWRLRRHARTLADLQRRLGQIPAPDGLAPGPVPGDRVVHLDLHPINVLLSSRGPMVIDWTNARAGDPASDVALTWVLTACGTIPGSGVLHALQSRFRDAFLRAYLRAVDREAARAALAPIVEWKTQDRNMNPDEVAAMRALLAREDTSP